MKSKPMYYFALQLLLVFVFLPSVLTVTYSQPPPAKKIALSAINANGFDGFNGGNLLIQLDIYGKATVTVTSGTFNSLGNAIATTNTTAVTFVQQVQGGFGEVVIGTGSFVPSNQTFSTTLTLSWTGTTTTALFSVYAAGQALESTTITVSLQSTNIPCLIANVTTTSQFVDFADCILKQICTLQWEKLLPCEQEELSGYYSVLTSAVQRLNTVMHQDIIPNVNPSDTIDYAIAIRNSYILEEMAEFQYLQINPNVSTTRKKRAEEESLGSIKELLKQLAEEAPWGFETIVKFLVDVICEILEIL